MIRKDFACLFANVQKTLLKSRFRSSSALNLEKLEQESIGIDANDEELRIKEEEIERKRNKSRLAEAHRNLLLDKKPYVEPMHWIHGTVKYNRKLYGQYGEASGVNPAICWPLKEELENRLEYERVAYPYTIPEMIETSKQKRLQRKEFIRKREEEIAQKMLKLDTWIKEMKEKIAKKEMEAITAKARKDKLIEEVRRHFGYTVDSRDEKFKEMVEKKEKEQKKALKEERKKAKEEKLMKKLMEKKPETVV